MRRLGAVPAVAEALGPGGRKIVGFLLRVRALRVYAVGPEG